MHPERFPSGIVKKLQACSDGPFKILKNLRPDTYVVDLPPDYGYNSTFNVADLVAYKEPTMIPSEPFESSPLLESKPTSTCPLSQRARHEHIEKILDEQVITTKSNEY